MVSQNEDDPFKDGSTRQVKLILHRLTAYSENYIKSTSSLEVRYIAMGFACIGLGT